MKSSKPKLALKAQGCIWQLFKPLLDIRYNCPFLCLKDFNFKMNYFETGFFILAITWNYKYNFLFRKNGTKSRDTYMYLHVFFFFLAFNKSRFWNWVEFCLTGHFWEWRASESYILPDFSSCLTANSFFSHCSETVTSML